MCPADLKAVVSGSGAGVNESGGLLDRCRMDCWEPG